MTRTLTTEQLRARAKFWREKAVEAKWESVSIAQDMLQNADAFDELAANREAQPVLYASEETLAYAKEGEKSLVTWSEPMGDAVIPLFTIPKVQTSGVVNLPTEFISDEGVMVRLEQVMAALALVGVKYERRGDACRAAMLAQPVSGGYTLPDNVREALTLALQAMEFMGDTLNNIDAVCTEDVEYVTPAFNAVRELLAAAPEGGNG